MRAGALKHSVIIQQKSEVQDEAGNSNYTWGTFATVRAAIWPVSAKEQISNMQPEHTITHRVQIRYISGLTTKMRLLWGNRVLDIERAINPEQKNRKLDLLCEEVT